MEDIDLCGVSLETDMIPSVDGAPCEYTLHENRGSYSDDSRMNVVCQGGTVFMTAPRGIGRGNVLGGFQELIRAQVMDYLGL